MKAYRSEPVAADLVDLQEPGYCLADVEQSRRRFWLFVLARGRARYRSVSRCAGCLDTVGVDGACILW